MNNMNEWDEYYDMHSYDTNPSSLQLGIRCDRILLYCTRTCTVLVLVATSTHDITIIIFPSRTIGKSRQVYSQDICV